MRAQKLAPEDPTLKSLLVSARLFDYLGMKCLYAVEWAGYFRELKGIPDTKLVTLYIGIQMNAQDHGMVSDLIDKISGLREPYREAWLTESTPYRLGSALAKWDAESQYWLDVWHRLNELLRTHNKNEPFPSIDVLRTEDDDRGLLFSILIRGDRGRRGFHGGGFRRRRERCTKRPGCVIESGNVEIRG